MTHRNQNITFFLFVCVLFVFNALSKMDYFSEGGKALLASIVIIMSGVMLLYFLVFSFLSYRKTRSTGQLIATVFFAIALILMIPAVLGRFVKNLKTIRQEFMRTSPVATELSTEGQPAQSTSSEQSAQTAGIAEVTTKAQLDNLIQQSSEKPLVVKVSATWCPPCKALKPNYEAVAQELGDKIMFAEIDADNLSQFPDLNVPGLPTLIMYKDGQELRRTAGYHETAELKDEFSKLIQ